MVDQGGRRKRAQARAGMLPGNHTLPGQRYIQSARAGLLETCKLPRLTCWPTTGRHSAVVAPENAVSRRCGVVRLGSRSQQLLARNERGGGRIAGQLAPLGRTWRRAFVPHAVTGGVEEK